MGRRKRGVDDELNLDELEEDRARFCKGTDPMFGGGCCEIIDKCLDYALVNNLSGVYGGTSTKQRIQIRKRKSKAA